MTVRVLVSLPADIDLSAELIDPHRPPSALLSMMESEAALGN
jgi:hypothetical protein